MRIKIWVVLMLFCANVMAQNSYPPLYGAIGDKIYAASEGYRTLVKLDSFQENRDALNFFISETDRLKSEGFSLTVAATKEQRSSYITSLRRLLQEKKVLDHAVLKKIDMLKALGKKDELSQLSQNPYVLIRNAAYDNPALPSSNMKKNDTEEMPADLRQSLGELKEKLLEARMQNSPDMQCLNDITAMNYWMAAADEQKAGRAWCEANDACEQVINFESEARKSCSKEHPLYEKWRAYSITYRTTLKKELSEACY